MKNKYIIFAVAILALLSTTGLLLYRHLSDSKKISELESAITSLQSEHNALTLEYQTLSYEYDEQLLLIESFNSSSELDSSVVSSDITDGVSDIAEANPDNADSDDAGPDDSPSSAENSDANTNPNTDSPSADESDSTPTEEHLPAEEPTPPASQTTYTYSYGQNVSYFAIGNSITVHGENEYWWNNIGMSATSIDKDYVHLVAAGIQNITGSVTVNAYNFYPWEVQVDDRAETFTLLDFMLDTQPDIISIQLSENVLDMSHYQSDWEELIRYVQNKCPNAQIIIIDDFWYGGDKSTLKKKAADNTGVQFVSLSAIRNNEAYKCGLGTTVYDADGNPHIVEHEGVAKHPNDAGMQYIADGILSYIH